MISPVTNSIPTVQTTNKTIQYVEAICGSGKTEGLIKKLNESDDKYMIAVSTNKNGEALAKRIDGSIFVNRGDGGSKVYQKIQDVVGSYKVIIVTHSGLATLTPVAYLLTDYHLFVDELSGNLIASHSLTDVTKIGDYKHLKPYFKLKKEKSLQGVGKVRH
jgi:hypothetical protein